MRQRVTQPKTRTTNDSKVIQTGGLIILNWIINNEHWIINTLAKITRSASIEKIILLGNINQGLSEKIKQLYPNSVLSSDDTETDSNLGRGTVIISNLYFCKLTDEELWEAASIQSGFRFGELAGLLHIDWHWDEKATKGGIHAITTNNDYL